MLQQATAFGPFMREPCALLQIAYRAREHKITDIIGSMPRQWYNVLNVIFLQLAFTVIACIMLPSALLFNLLQRIGPACCPLRCTPFLLSNSASFVTSCRVCIAMPPCAHLFWMSGKKSALSRKNVGTLCLVSKLVIQSAASIIPSPLYSHLCRIFVVNFYLPRIRTSFTDSIQPVATSRIHRKKLKGGRLGLVTSGAGHRFRRGILPFLPTGIGCQLACVLACFAIGSQSTWARLRDVKVLGRVGKPLLAVRATLIHIRHRGPFTHYCLHTGFTACIQAILRGLRAFTGIEEFKGCRFILLALCAAFQCSGSIHALNCLSSSCLVLAGCQGNKAIPFSHGVITPTLCSHRLSIPFLFVAVKVEGAYFG